MILSILNINNLEIYNRIDIPAQSDHQIFSSRLRSCISKVLRGEAPGNIVGLVDAALEVHENNAPFREGARRLAEERYGLDRMVDQYMEVFSQKNFSES